MTCPNAIFAFVRRWCARANKKDDAAKKQPKKKRRPTILKFYL
jgi:hypothetical protein